LIIEYKLSLKCSLLPLQDKIQYRRKAILELKSKGLTNVAIASTLQYDVSTIERDLQSLRKFSLRDEYGGPIV
jgi:DNA-binding NarL/FixJ family response regulator